MSGSSAQNVDFRVLVESVKDLGIFFLDPDGKIISANTGAQILFGRAAAEIIGLRFSQLCTPAQGTSNASDALKFAADRGHYEEEGWRMRPAGPQFWANIVFTAMRDHAGQLLGYSAIVRDFTERHRAEQALKDHEARLRSIVDHAVDVIITIDERGAIESINPATERMFDHSSGELIGQNISMLLPSPFQEHGDDFLLNRMTMAEQQVVRFGGRVTGRRKDGATFPVELAISELEIAGKRRFTALIHDISNRQRAEEQRERLLASERSARAQAERASRAKDEFLAALSHELRTPLTPALLTISLLERDRNLPARFRPDIEVIRRNVEMEARLIDDLLDLTRIMNHTMVMAIQDVDLHAILQNAERACRGEDGIVVRLDLSAEEHHVRADPARLQQVFWNLLSNAHKFTAIGGTIAVRSANPSPGQVEVEVTDTGRGIEPELLPRIFNAFEQGDAQMARRFGGLGLGLTISKAILDAHGASISVQSPGKGLGTVFKVSLATASPAEAEATAVSSPGLERVFNEKLRILLVEDHEPTLKIVSRLLRELGHEIYAARTVQEAMSCVDNEKFDLLISDLGLPDGSGYDVMMHAATRGLKGIALSGYGMTDDIERSREAGFANHLIKPVDMQTLTSAIGQACAV